ncbi:hypothetical protein Y1Q_0020563 [Alligator mississippiensis]|uniref:Uncharacterized protein n=1 Tax=Alligator mississippiensis TaxID=8496 RepID=A0A151NRC9_ALLMI|nr:hypothetical protein Y1Q_0020563 [Alligator mississippiensis]
MACDPLDLNNSKNALKRLDDRPAPSYLLRTPGISQNNHDASTGFAVPAGSPPGWEQALKGAEEARTKEGTWEPTACPECSCERHFILPQVPVDTGFGPRTYMFVPGGHNPHTATTSASR